MAQVEDLCAHTLGDCRESDPLLHDAASALFEHVLTLTPDAPLAAACALLNLPRAGGLEGLWHYLATARHEWTEFSPPGTLTGPKENPCQELTDERVSLVASSVLQLSPRERLVLTRTLRSAVERALAQPQESQPC